MSLSLTIYFSIFVCVNPLDTVTMTLSKFVASLSHFSKQNTATDHDVPHQLRNAATHVLQLRTFSPASAAGTTTRDEMIGILCGCPRLQFIEIHFFFHSFNVFPLNYSRPTHIHPVTLLRSLYFQCLICLQRYGENDLLCLQFGRIDKHIFAGSIVNR